MQAVIERELVDAFPANAVSPAVADVAENRPLGTQHEGRTGRPHAVEIAVERAAFVNGGIGRFERPFERVDDVQVAELEKRMADGVGRDFAGQLADGVPPMPSATSSKWPCSRQVCASEHRRIA